MIISLGIKKLRQLQNTRISLAIACNSKSTKTKFAGGCMNGHSQFLRNTINVI